MDKLLVALGGREESDRLTAAAARLAGTGAHVDVVHAVHPDEDRAEAEQVLFEAAAGLRRRGFDVGTLLPDVPPGGVAEELSRLVRERGSDLVVIGSRGLGHVGAIVRGSVSHALLARTTSAVLIVSREARVGEGPLRRVLAAVAGDVDARAVTAAVQRLDGKAEVLVVHVPRLVGVHVSTGGGSYLEVPETSHVTLGRAVGQLKRRGVHVEAKSLEHSGPPAQAIAQAADQWAAELVVVGSRRLADWESLLVGSVSQELCRHCDLPVLVAPRPEAAR